MELAAERSDEALLVDVAEGHAEAFRELVGRYQDRVIGYLRRMAGEESARDLAQDTFLRVWQSAPGFRGDASAKTWIFRIATNAMRDRHRRKGIDPLALAVEPPAGGGESWEPVLVSPGNPFERLAELEQQQILEDAIAQLSAPLRAVLVLSLREGMTYAEIARTLGIAKGTVCSRKVAALAQLNRTLRFLENER